MPWGFPAWGAGTGASVSGEGSEAAPGQWHPMCTLCQPDPAQSPHAAPLRHLPTLPNTSPASEVLPQHCLMPFLLSAPLFRGLCVLPGEGKGAREAGAAFPAR